MKNRLYLIRRVLLYTGIFIFLLYREVTTTGIIDESNLDIFSKKLAYNDYEVKFLEGEVVKRYYANYWNSKSEIFDISFLQFINEAISFYELSQYVDFYFIIALIEVESQFLSTALSKAGAYGYTQIMSITEKHINERYFFESPLNRKDPYENIIISIVYLKELFDRFEGDTEKVLRFYNGGGNWKILPSTKKYYKVIKRKSDHLRSYAKELNLV